MVDARLDGLYPAKQGLLCLMFQTFHSLHRNILWNLRVLKFKSNFLKTVFLINNYLLQNSQAILYLLDYYFSIKFQDLNFITNIACYFDFIKAQGGWHELKLAAFPRNLAVQHNQVDDLKQRVLKMTRMEKTKSTIWGLPSEFFTWVYYIFTYLSNIPP